MFGAISMTACASGDGNSRASEVSALQVQLDKALDRADNAEAKIKRLEIQLKALQNRPATSVAPGAAPASGPDATDPAGTGPASTPPVATDATRSTPGRPGRLGTSSLVRAFGDLTGITLPTGDPGVVVIASSAGADSSGSVAVLVRNNTADVIGSIEVTGTVRDATGKLVGSELSPVLEPIRVSPGEVAFGYISYPADELPDGAAFEFLTNFSDIANESHLSATITELTVLPDKLVGIASNDNDQKIIGPIGVTAICFDAQGLPTRSVIAFLDQDELPPGGKGSFSIDVADGPCDRGFMGASGFNF